MDRESSIADYEKYSKTFQLKETPKDKNLLFFCLFVTPRQNHGGIIFSLQFVCMCVCLSVNKIPVERVHRFGRFYP